MAIQDSFLAPRSGRFATMNPVRANLETLRASSCGAVALAGLCVLVSCASVQPPRVATTGALPVGTNVNMALAADGVDDELLNTQMVVTCLVDQGFSVNGEPHYVAQYAAAVRPTNSQVRTGKAADQAQGPGTHSRAPSGQRIFYSLTIQRLADGAQIYDLRADANYKPRRSTAESRAAQFCSSIQGQLR